MNDFSRILGLDVFVSHALEEVPKFKISQSCPMTDAYRADTNEWLIRIFGYAPITFQNGNRIYFSPKTYEKLISSRLMADSVTHTTRTT